MDAVTTLPGSNSINFSDTPRFQAEVSQFSREMLGVSVSKPNVPVSNKGCMAFNLWDIEITNISQSDS